MSFCSEQQFMRKDNGEYTSDLRKDCNAPNIVPK